MTGRLMTIVALAATGLLSASGSTRADDYTYRAYHAYSPVSETYTETIETIRQPTAPPTVVVTPPPVVLQAPPQVAVSPPPVVVETPARVVTLRPVFGVELPGICIGIGC